MQRRTFLKHSALVSMMLALGINPKELNAATIPTAFDTTLVNIFLNGGPDFRHLIVPVFSADTSSYGYTYWFNRAALFSITPSDTAALQNYFTANYDTVTLSNETFGIMKKAAWLKQEIESGNVAIINNVGGSTSRNHLLSQMVAESGNPAITQMQGYSHSGWGGRVAQSLNANVVSLSHVIRTFAKGAKNGDMYKADYNSIINVNDSRNMGLYHFDTAASMAQNSSEWQWSDKAVMSRALKSYFQAKRATLSSDSLYAPIFENEKKLREFGELINTRLQDVPSPQAFNDLLANYSGDYSELDFIRQVSGLYDMYACADLVNMRVASLDYLGWDSHKFQADTLARKFELLFGTNKALQNLMDALQANIPNAYENTIFALYGEFGRQLKANGGGGTDHGKGNIVLLIGSSVEGGIYGELFPQSELDSNNKHSYAAISGDIEPRTAMNTLFAHIANNITNDSQSAQAIFPAGSFDMLEDGVDFTSLFRAT